MSEKKEKKKGFKHFLTVLFVLALISIIGGVVVAYFVELPPSISFMTQVVDLGNDLLNQGLSVGVAIFFFFMMCWLFASTKASDSGTPRQMTNGDYNVDSDQKGSARWLTDKEIDQLFPKCAYDDAYKMEINGFVVQTKRIGGKTYANYRSGYHCLIIGSTGSGKTIRFVIPTMQLLGRSKLHPSIVVTDPKGELYNSQTKLYKANGYDIVSINLREPLKKSSCWNPCYMAYCEYQEALEQKSLIKRHTDKLDAYPKLTVAGDRSLFKEVWYEFSGYAFSTMRDAMIEAERKTNSLKAKSQESINDLVDTVYAESQRKANDPYWVKSGKSMVQGLLLAMLEDSEIKDLGITAERFNLGTISSILSLRVELLKSYFNIRDSSSNAKRIASSAINAPESGTRESIISTALADLTPFADPDIQYITCNNDIDFKNIGRRPTVVFLIIPDEKENRHVFASLFITQAYKSLVELASGPEGVKGACPHPVNFIIDEFANMPVIPGMDNKITVARSRGISFMLIIQALSQLNAKYTADVAKIISSNCNMQVFLASNDNETAEYFSKICGEKTTREKNVSVASDGKESYSYSLNSRALIKPEELLTLAEGTSIVKLLRQQPAKLHQVEFWKDSSYIIGEQVIETKWNPNVFTFDVDGYYDIAVRCQNDAMYKINHVNVYSLLNNDDDDEDTSTSLKSSTGTDGDDDTSFTNMEIDKKDEFDDLDLNIDDWLNDADLSWDSLFEDDDVKKPTEPIATTADIVNAAAENKNVLTEQNKVENITTLSDWIEMFDSKNNINNA